MHLEIHHFIKEVKSKYPHYFKGKEVLEVGSLDINGSVRSHFRRCCYIGIDIGEGKGVDLICPAHEYVRFKGHDVIISTEMLEHDEHWRKSLRQMYGNLRPGGLLLITCASDNRPEHGTLNADPCCSPYTQGYYRNISIADFMSVLPPEFFETYVIANHNHRQDLHFYGIKPLR
jgi:SAM-dependent methyltransferase